MCPCFRLNAVSMRVMPLIRHALNNDALIADCYYRLHSKVYLNFTAVGIGINSMSRLTKKGGGGAGAGAGVAASVANPQQAGTGSPTFNQGFFTTRLTPNQRAISRLSQQLGNLYPMMVAFEDKLPARHALSSLALESSRVRLHLLNGAQDKVIDCCDSLIDRLNDVWAHSKNAHASLDSLIFEMDNPGVDQDKLGRLISSLSMQPAKSSAVVSTTLGNIVDAAAVVYKHINQQATKKAEGDPVLFMEMDVEDLLDDCISKLSELYGLNNYQSKEFARVSAALDESLRQMESQSMALASLAETYASPKFQRRAAGVVGHVNKLVKDCKTVKAIIEHKRELELPRDLRDGLESVRHQVAAHRRSIGGEPVVSRSLG